MLFETATGSPASNIDSSDTPYDNNSDRQSAATLKANDIHKQTTTSPLNNYRPNSSKHMLTHSVTNFEKTKQTIMDIDPLSHLPTLHNKILQKLNLSDLCQYHNAH